MNVKGFTTVGDVYSSYAKNQDFIATSKVSEAAEAPAVENAVVYEPTQPSKLVVANRETIARLKANSEERMAQIEQLVTQLIFKQGKTYSYANGSWADKQEITPEMIAQAQADIAEDGYWGVSQTSERIVDFATALTAGDATKIDSMMEAFEKGYAQAEKSFGSKLPDISSKTYDAVMTRFEEIKAANAS